MFNLTMLFHVWTDDGRVAGFSESWYHPGGQAAAELAIRNLALARKELLPASGKLLGWRIHELGKRAFTVPFAVDGRPDLEPDEGGDVPQMAVQCVVDADGGINAWKRFFLRGIPDQFVRKGSYKPNAAFARSMRAFGEALHNWNLQFRYRLKTAPTQGILGITTNGTFTLKGDMDFAAGDTFTMLAVRDVNGKPVSGNFYVLEKTDARTGKLNEWPGNTVGTKGSVRKLVYQYTSVKEDSFRVERSAVRKVGSPFGRYRGR